jgi:hypothetical protein
MKIKFYVSILVLFFSYHTIIAQEQYLAKIGNTEISASEFNNRFEFTPKVKSDFDSTKVNFLYSIIAEKLWALEAQSLSMDSIPYVYNSVKNIERKLVKDKLYKIEVENKVRIKEREIEEDLAKVNEKRIVNFVFSFNKSEIEDLYARLYSGEIIDSVLIGRVEQKEQVSGIPVIYGQMDKDLEDEIFMLKLNQFSKPIPINDGWIIYSLKDILFNSPNDKNREANRKKVEETIFARKAKLFYNEFYSQYIKGNVINTDKPIFNKLSEEIFKRFEIKGETFYNKNIKKYQLDENQIKIIRNSFSKEQLSSSFIKFEISPISLDKYLLSLELNGFNTNDKNKQSVSHALNSNIKAYIFEELLFREGFSRGLQNSVEIKYELNNWRESFLASYFRHSFLDSVETNETQVKNYYNKIISENKNQVTKTYSEVKEKIKSGLYFNELENLYIDRTVDLAKKYGVSVNINLLNSIQVTDIEMMVYRQLGFGGEITAVPYLQSFYKWKYWLPKSLKQQLP